MHIITRLVRGGAQRIVLDLAHGMRAHGVEPIIVSGVETGEEGSLWEEAAALGIETRPVEPLVRDISPWRDWRALWGLQRLIRESRPDVVHAHTSKAGMLGCLAGRMARVQAVIFSPHGHVLRDDAEIPGVPRRGVKRALIAAAVRRHTRFAHRVIAPNEVEREEGIALGLWSAERCVAIDNGVDTERFRPSDRAAARERLGVTSAEPLIGIVARLTREKGVDLALEALSSIEPNARMVIVGDGPERDALTARARDRGPDGRVLFAGVRTDVERVLPAFDLLMIPSRSEAHGLVAAEAMACEVPVAAARVGGLPRMVIDGETGLLVAPRDPQALAAAANRLLHDRELARRLAARGRRHVVERYSLQTMIDRTFALYREPVGVVPS